MKKPERLLGFLTFEETRFPFEFDRENFSLRLYPPDRETQGRYNSLLHVFGKLKRFQEHNNEWIPFEDLRGETGEGHRVCFHVSSDYQSYYGFLSFTVAWYFVWEKEYPEEAIRGLRLRGPEIDAFFPAESAYRCDIQPADGLLRAQKITLSAECRDETDGGSFPVSEDLEASVLFHSWAAFAPSPNPLTTNSSMTLMFSAAVGLPALVHIHAQLRRFFMYAANRANVSLDTAEIFTLNQEGKRRYYGWLGVPSRFEPETSPKAGEQIIGFPILGTKTADLLRTISEGEISYEYLPHSIEEKRSYTVSRFILILAAFEREFRNIYGTDPGRSEAFLRTKEEVVRLLEEYCAGKTGREKRYSGDLLNGVRKFSLGYWFQVEYALKDCRAVMESFTIRTYGPGRSYDELAEEIGRRVGDLRNDLAHDRLDWSFEAVQISDIKVMEELMYVIRLKRLGLQTEQIRTAIKKLFQEA